VKSQRYDLKYILLQEIIVLFQIVKKSLLVADEIVELKMIVDSFVCRIFSLFEEIVFKVFYSVGKFKKFLRIVSLFKEIVIVLLISFSEYFEVVGRQRSFVYSCFYWLLCINHSFLLLFFRRWKLEIFI
jgi:hypothetical protein